MVSRKVAQRKSVDLPEPDGPMMLTTSPLSTLKLMSFSTSWSPKCFLMFFISRIMGFSLPWWVLWQEWLARRDYL